MKKYEILNIELENVTDVIVTSADVTTGSITIPWQESDRSGEGLALSAEENFML
ncbi:MAG: hypothetical protein IKB38_00050 [Clostridia bacterium]|nr:hypothetical protein [Clostridia bacterium]